MQRKAHMAIDEHRALCDPTIDKLGGVHPSHSPQPQTREGGNAQSNTVSFTEESRNSQAQNWHTQSDGRPAVDPEQWRQYATPAATPTGDDTWLESGDSIHVDIAPVEPGTEQSNWELFIHQLGEDL